MRGQQSQQGQTQTAQAKQPKRPRRGINENYARELMELHTLGVEGGYTQKDVQEVARAFTGWTIFAPRGRGLYGGDAAEESRAGTFLFNPRMHDSGEKTVLGRKISGGGMDEGEKGFGILLAHPPPPQVCPPKTRRSLVYE